MTDTIAYRAEGDVAEITLDDGKLNVMSLAFFQALGSVLDRAEAERPRAVVLAGRTGAFSAGLNLKVVPKLPPDELHETAVAFARTILRVFTFPIPTVAAVTGHAIAGGALLAFACDLRHMAEGAFRLQMNEVAIGLTLPTWALAVAGAGIPPRWHTEALLHARAYSPAEAFERGMVDRLVHPERLLGEARAAAAALTALDSVAYAKSKARHRAMVVTWATDRLETEFAVMPTRLAR